MRDLFLIIHLIGLVMAVGTGFANQFLGAAAAKLEPAERASFMGKTTVLLRMGQTGLGLLILSGLYLMTPFWKTLSDRPTLIAKLVLVVLVIVMVTYISLEVRRSKKENNPALLAKLKPLAMLNFLVGITILVLAVLTFH
jgi:uncharacterized membrane protein